MDAKRKLSMEYMVGKLPIVPNMGRKRTILISLTNYVWKKNVMYVLLLDHPMGKLPIVQNMGMKEVS